MEINVVRLKIEKEYSIQIPGNCDYVYGVETAAPIFCGSIGANNVEYVAVLCLDNKNMVVNYSTAAIGFINNVKVNVAQILKVALLSNASKIIIAHNHPSGVLEVTQEDVDMTKKIGALAKYFDIELIDSIVVNSVAAVSIREKVGGLANER